jgi:predicted Rossmann fold nucleotide-binding protein DprA/Smf involved in DNA uptake
MNSDLCRFADDREARIEALRRYLAGLLTEPLKPGELAALFRVPAKTMGAMLRNLERRGRAERAGRRWRVRLSEMPPSYAIAAGFLDARE